MLELLQIAITGANLIPTALLGVVLLYWLLVILGALDLGFLDFDVSLDGDANVEVDVASPDGVGGVLQSIMIYFNLGKIPVSILLSVWFILFWMIAMLMFQLLHKPPVFIQLGLLVPYLLGALFATKIVTIPLKGVLDLKGGISNRETVGQICTLLQDLTPGRLGQGSVKTEGAPLSVNVMVKGELQIKKGDTALIVEKDNEKEIYYIEPFTEWKE
jgi:hypothetical protein